MRRNIPTGDLAGLMQAEEAASECRAEEVRDGLNGAAAEDGEFAAGHLAPENEQPRAEFG